LSNEIYKAKGMRAKLDEELIEIPKRCIALKVSCQDNLNARDTHYNEWERSMKSSMKRKLITIAVIIGVYIGCLMV
jgi:hypothetical protein